MSIDWIFKLTQEVTNGAESPEEAIKMVHEWGKAQEPRDYALVLFTVRMANEDYKKLKRNNR